MPRLVDHAERRAQITDAARRVVARDGLDAATFQAVAAEAGVSVRLVQYYFGNKDGLLAATHRAVIDASAARFGTVGPPVPASLPPADEVLRGVVAALLPLDDERRADAVVLAAFHAAALTHDGLDQETLLPAPRALVEVVAAQLDRWRARDGATPPAAGPDAGRDAELVLAALAGLTQAVLARHLTPDGALAVADRLLDHLLRSPDDATPAP